MTYTLYSHDGSGGFIVEAALAKAQAPYRIIVVDTEKSEQMDPSFTAINPLHQVPAMTLPDGTLMTESAACTIHLTCAYPDCGLAPAPGSAGHGAFLRWMVFLSVNGYEPVLRYFYPDRYTSDPASIDAVKSAAQKHLSNGFEIVETALADQDFLCGDTLSMADTYLAMLMQWDENKPTSPKLAAIEQAVAADPVIGPIFRRHGF